MRLRNITDLGGGGVRFLLLTLLVSLAALAGLTLSAAAQTGDDGADDADPQGRIIARIQDRTDDDGVDDYRIEFGFFPQWAMEDKDPWAEAITTWSDWLPRARYLTKTVIDRRDADDNRRWLRSSLISVPAGPSAQQDGGPDADFEDEGDDQQGLIEGRVVARYNPDSRGRLRVEFGFLPECAFESTSNTEEAVEQYGEDLLPRARYLSATMIESRRGVWLRSSVVDVPSTCDGPTDPMTTITITSSRLSFEQREEVGSQRIGTVEGPLTDGLDRFTTSGLPAGLTIALTDASANVRRLLLSGTVDPEAVPQLYEVRITVRPPEGEAVSDELAIRILEGDGRQELTWSGYTPDTQRVGGRVTLQQPRVVRGPSPPQWSYASDTSRICTVDRRTGDLTLVAIGQCLVTATSAAREGFREEPIQTEVTVTDKPQPVIRWRGYSPLEATVGESAPRFLPPTATVDGHSVRLTYTYEVDEDSERAGICDVNARNGQIDAMAAGTCVLIANSAETDEYAAASSDPVSVTIVDEKQDPDLRWDGYDDENLRAGGDPIRPIREPQPRVREARGKLTYTYSATPSSICSVNSTGELTPWREGACDVTARSEATEEFLAGDVMVTVRVGPGPGRPDLDWFDYPDSPAVANGDALRPSRPGSRDRVGPLSYRSQTPSICSVDSRTGLLSGRERGTCRVTVTSEETDELLEGSETISVRIIPLPLPEPCELNYPRDVEVGGQIGPELDCGDGDARATYEEETPTICSVNPNSGDVTGLDEGQCRITVTVPATSRYAEATARATLAVIDDEPPTCSDIADVGPLDSGESSRRIYLDDYCEDPEGERLSYAATPSDINVATVSVSGRETLTVTAARRPSGTSAQITVVATDPGGKTGRTSFRVTVDGNTDPERVGSISNVTLDVDDTETIDVSGNFRDADGDPLTYEVDSDDSAVRVRVSGSRVTVEGRRTGSATITVTADDRNGGTPAEQTFNVTVNERPPEIRISCPSAADVGESITCTVSNSGGAITTYSWTDSDGGSGSSSSYRTSFSSSGTKTVSLTARNSADSDSDSISDIDITEPEPVNRAPTCSSIPDLYLPNLISTGRFDLSTYCTDPDRDPLRFRITESNTRVEADANLRRPSGLMVPWSSNTVIVGDVDLGPGSTQVRLEGERFGTATLTVTATDHPGGLSTTTSFEVKVGNLAPVLTCDPLPTSYITWEDSPQITASTTVDVGDCFTDPEDSALAYTVKREHDYVRASVSGSRITVTARYLSLAGSGRIEITAWDNGRSVPTRGSTVLNWPIVVLPWAAEYATCDNQPARVGSKSNIYYFNTTSWTKHYLDLSVQEFLDIVGSSRFHRTGQMSSSYCDDWTTGDPYDESDVRSIP